MKITVMIMHDPPLDKDYSGADSHTFYRRGDIIAVDRQHSEPCTARRMAFIHIDDAPEKGTGPVTNLLRIRAFLMGPVVENEGTTDQETIRRRKHRLLIPELNSAQRAALANDREINITWNYFRNRTAVKVPTDPTDPLQDDETGRFVDDDIPSSRRRN